MSNAINEKFDNLILAVFTKSGDSRVDAEERAIRALELSRTFVNFRRFLFCSAFTAMEISRHPCAGPTTRRPG